MKLEEIGFYTLSDRRAQESGVDSGLERCEILLTNKCNFKCPYCRGIHSKYRESMTHENSERTVRLWCNQGLKNIRFSGGEPTLYPKLYELVELSRGLGVERCAISTNGSADVSTYWRLIDAGVDDFSISLDGGCCSVGDVMSGVSGSWYKVINNIREISKYSYCTVGMVFTERNVHQVVESVKFAMDLGVSDIRVIPSAQYDKALEKLAGLPDEVISEYPILKYRINNIRNGRYVRGIHSGNNDKCWLAIDDMCVVGKYHFPCIIHFREGGDPIGEIGESMRRDRYDWIVNHSPKDDEICKKNCLDVCVDFNRKHHFNN